MERLFGSVIEVEGDGVDVVVVQPDSDLPLGRYRRSNPLVFSLEPRSQGGCGSAKKMYMLICAVRPASPAISLPWS